MSQVDQMVFSMMMMGLHKYCVPNCLKKPGANLTNNEKECLASCQDKYMDGYQVAFQEAALRYTEDQKRT